MPAIQDRQVKEPTHHISCRHAVSFQDNTQKLLYPEMVVRHKEEKTQVSSGALVDKGVQDVGAYRSLSTASSQGKM